MPLHVDLRPTCFEDFIGNRSTGQSLQSVLKKKDRPHTYMFTGPSGCGKTTLARITAESCGCSGFDLKEINCSNQRTIEDARDIIRKCNLQSLKGKEFNRGWILDEFHLFGEGGDSPKNKPQNALLKVLEEPPKHVYFFICSTDPQNILKTIRSRCTSYEVSPLTSSQMNSLLSKTAKAAGVDSIPGEVLDQIGKDSRQHPREALTILEKIIELPPNQMLRAAKQSAQIESQAIDLARMLLKKGVDWRAIAKILSGLPDKDYEGVRRMVRSYCSAILLKEDNPQAFLIMNCFSKPFYNDGKAELIEACYESVME